MKTHTIKSERRIIHRRTRQMLLLCGALTLGGSLRLFAEDEIPRTYSNTEGRIMLQSELAEFERYVDSSMKAGRMILKDRKIPEAELALFSSWQTSQKALLLSAIHQDDPLRALIDSWAACASLTYSASLNELPASTRDVALDLVKRREDRLTHIATRYLPQDSITSLANSIDAFATAKPVLASDATQPEARRWTTPLFSVWAKSQQTTGNLFQIPLMPGRALKGVSESGKALSGIRDTTAEAVLVAGQLPERIRTEFQIALADLVDQRAEIIELLNAMDSVSTHLRATAESGHLAAAKAQESLVLARELLPAGETLANAVARAVNASSELVKSLGEASARSENTGISNRFDIVEYQQTATAISSAASEVHQLLVEIRSLIDRNLNSQQTDTSEPFDIRPYGAAAESIRGGSAELRTLISELHQIADDDAFGNRIKILFETADASAKRTTGLAEKLIDHLAWRLLQVATVVFCIAFVMIFHTRRRPTGPKL
jgi:hypothetical protein